MRAGIAASAARTTGPVKFEFPGLAGAYLSTPNLWLGTLTEQELLVRVATPWKQPIADQTTGFAGFLYMPGGGGGVRRVVNTSISYYAYSADLTAFSVTAVIPAGWVDNQMVWLRCTSTDTAVTLEWAPDQATIPTSWTTLGTTVKTKPGQAPGTGPTMIGTDSFNGATRYLAGRIARAIVRSTIGGTALLDVSDTDLTDHTATTFPSGDTGNRYASLPGVQGNNLTVPNAASLQITGDLTVIFRANRATFTASDWRAIAGKFTAGQQSWWIGFFGNTLYYTFSVNGTTQEGPRAMGAPWPATNVPTWIAVTHDVDNGAGGNDVRVFTSPDGSTWTQFGATSTIAGVVSRFAGTSILAIGSNSTNGQYPLLGQVRRLMVNNGIGAAGVPGGTTVFDFDASTDLVNVHRMSPVFTAKTGQVVTALRTAIAAPTELFDGRPRVAEAGDVIKPVVCVDVLREPFDHFSAWTVNSTPVVVAGRTGTAAEINSISDRLDYNLGANENATVTIGFAWRTPVLQATHTIVRFSSDAGATTHTTLSSDAAGRLTVSSGGTGLVQTATGIVAINTWYYVELRFTLGDAPNGAATVRLNGAEVINATGLDTKSGGTKTVYDTVVLPSPNPSSGGINQYDDLYISTIAGCPFKGDQAIVNTGPDVLLEPFNNLTAWNTTSTSFTIVAGGRTGNGTQSAGTTSLPYTIPAALENATLTIGVAVRVSVLTSARTLLFLRSDAGVIIHNSVQVEMDGSIAVRRGNAGGIILGQTAAGLVAINTWYYLELQARLHDTLGTIILRLDGVERLNLTAQDTANGGTKTVYDSVSLQGSTGGTNIFDDLYITVGAGAPFKGSITL